MCYQKNVADNEDEGEDSDADVEAVLVHVEGGVGNEPTNQTDNGRHVKNNKKKEDGIFESLEQKKIYSY